MFGIGTGELLLLLLVALLVLGPERMPKLARDLGKTVNDLRRTSEELRNEFLEADKALNAERLLEVAARQTDAAETRASAPPDAGATQAEAETEPEETAFDREARLARERLEDPSAEADRDARARAEGWKPPEDEPGTSDRSG